MLGRPTLSSRRQLSLNGFFLVILSCYLLVQCALLWQTTTTTTTTTADTTPTDNTRLNAKQSFSDSNNDDDDNDDFPFYGQHVYVESNETVVAQALQGLPLWIQDYVHWHRQQRLAFPGMALFQDAAAPPVLIRTCFGTCGGLNDRLGQLPWDLYLANQTRRVLLIHWHRPVPMENFFLPFVLDWRVPVQLTGFFPSRKDNTVPIRKMLHTRNAVINMFDENDGMQADKPSDKFWREDLDRALAQAAVTSAPKILRQRLLGHLHEHVLEQRLAALGESDLIHNTTTFGRIFNLLFRPSSRIQERLNRINAQYPSLQTGRYTAVHCRVRHPKVDRVWRPAGQAGTTKTADKAGLLWQGDDRLWAIRTANHALACAATLPSSNTTATTTATTTIREPEAQPIYFLADSKDLVHYFVYELSNETYRQKHASTLTNDPVESKSLQLVQSAHDLISRPLERETLHLDTQKGRAVEAYDGTFVDFYLMTRAKCLVYGVGNFAWLAAKISQTTCRLSHQPEAWGGSVRKLERTPLCRINDNQRDDY